MKLGCSQVNKMIPDFLEDNLNTTEMSAFLSHIRGCRSCRDELETVYLIDYSLDYLDRGAGGAIDIDKLFREMLRKSEQRLRRRKVLTVVLWTAILAVAALLGVFLILFLIPGLFPWLPGPVQAVRRFLLDLIFRR